MMIAKKYSILFVLVIAIAITACAAGTGQESAAEQVAGTRPAAVVEPIPKDMSQEPPVLAEQLPMPDAKKETEPTPTVAPTDQPSAAVLPVIGQAPAWRNEQWINTDTPLPLEDLRGKVILLEFWTFG